MGESPEARERRLLRQAGTYPYTTSLRGAKKVEVARLMQSGFSRPVAEKAALSKTWYPVAGPNGGGLVRLSRDSNGETFVDSSTPIVSAGFTHRHTPATPEQTSLRQLREQQITARERELALTEEGLLEAEEERLITAERDENNRLRGGAKPVRVRPSNRARGFRRRRPRR